MNQSCELVKIQGNNGTGKTGLGDLSKYNGNIRNKLKWNIENHMTIFIVFQENGFENDVCKMLSILYRSCRSVCPMDSIHIGRCDMAFIEPMHRNKPNITYLLIHIGAVIQTRLPCYIVIMSWWTSQLAVPGIHTCSWPIGCTPRVVLTSIHPTVLGLLTDKINGNCCGWMYLYRAVCAKIHSQGWF